MLRSEECLAQVWGVSRGFCHPLYIPYMHFLYIQHIWFTGHIIWNTSRKTMHSVWCDVISCSLIIYSPSCHLRRHFFSWTWINHVTFKYGCKTSHDLSIINYTRHKNITFAIVKVIQVSPFKWWHYNLPLNKSQHLSLLNITLQY